MLLSLALSCVLQVAESPQLVETSSLDLRLDRLLEQYDLPALGGALVLDGKVRFLAARGVRRRGHEQAVTTTDQWHLGSCTKAMTGTLAALAVEEADLAWNSTLALLEPRFPEMHASWRSVTLIDLLQHVGGAPSGTSGYGTLNLAVRAAGEDAARGREILIRGLLRREAPDPPRKVYRYSNEGYVLASALIAHAFAETWEDSMRGRLFEPLGMTTAGFGPPGKAEKDSVPDQPEGHDANGTPMGRGPFADNPRALGPAGTVHASLRDWAQFAALHADQDPEFLPASRFAELYEVSPFEDYAAGWLVAERNWAGGLNAEGKRVAGPVLTHSGSNTLWYCTIWVAPERNLALLAVCNQATPAAPGACDAVISALLQQLDATDKK